MVIYSFYFLCLVEANLYRFIFSQHQWRLNDEAFQHLEGMIKRRNTFMSTTFKTSLKVFPVRWKVYSHIQESFSVWRSRIKLLLELWLSVFFRIGPPCSNFMNVVEDHRGHLNDIWFAVTCQIARHGTGSQVRRWPRKNQRDYHF